MSKITGGYYIKARQIQKSKIMRQPPHFREIWDWLLMEANHQDNKYNGFIIKRGQLFRTYLDIREGLCWYVGYRKMMYNENHVKKAMKFLRSAGMIETTKELGGVLITICNYDTYQEPKNYERTNERTNERTKAEPIKNQHIPGNNKNDNNDKNEKNIIITWRDDFEIYKSMLDKEYNRLINDQYFISKQQELNPGINIKLSLQKAKENYWAREVGWKKKKSSRSKTIDWEQTFINALTLPSNRVWKTKDEIEQENNSPRIIKDW